jgi:hypothetical protein
MDNFSMVGELNAIAGVFSHGAAMLSKTSFAVTLLRIVTRKLERFVIGFIIGTMNLVLALTLIFLLAQCRPIEASWDPFVQGDCWSIPLARYFGVFASGRDS